MAGGNKAAQAKQKGDILSFPVYQSTHIYRNTMVVVNSAGWAIQGIDTAGCFFAGMSEEEIDNSAGTDGALSIRVRRRGIYKMTLATTATAGSLVGELVYIDTVHSSSVNELVDIAANVTNHILVGEIVRHGTVAECIAGSNSTEVWVDILGCANTAYSATFASISTLAAHTNGDGAADIGIEDATGFGTSCTVQGGLGKLLKGRLSPSRISLEDGTAITKYSAGGVTPGLQQLSNKECVITWDGNAAGTAICAHFDVPDLLDGSANVEVHVLAAMAGTTDTPELTTEAYFNAGDTDCAGTDDEISGVTLTEYVNVIASGDVPDGPASLDIIMAPKAGEHGTDETYVYSIWLEYTKSVA